MPRAPNGPRGRLTPRAAKSRFDSSCTAIFLSFISRVVLRRRSAAAKDLPGASFGFGSRIGCSSLEASFVPARAEARSPPRARRPRGSVVRMRVAPCLALVFALSACGAPAASPPAAAAPTAAAPAPGPIDGPTAHALVKDGAALVDVRGPEEYAAGHIEGAVNVPIAEAATHDFGPKDKPVVLYCMHGRRSTEAGQVLRDRGYTRVYVLGPMSAWGER